jgi:hypothetical protein
MGERPEPASDENPAGACGSTVAQTFGPFDNGMLVFREIDEQRLGVFGEQLARMHADLACPSLISVARPPDMSRVRPPETGDAVEKGGLSTCRRPNDRQSLAGANGERDAAQHLNLRSASPEPGEIGFVEVANDE